MALHSPQDQLRALVHLVSICDRLNWDFLLGVLCDRLWTNTNKFSSGSLACTDWHSLKLHFAGYVREDGSLNYARRLKHLQLISEWCDKTDFLSRLEQSSVLDGPEGTRELLRHVPVYADDPLQKKSNVLINECLRRNLIRVDDEDKVQPAVDYHLIRLYLRTGRVMVRNQELADRLVRREPIRIERITAIRECVALAMKTTARHVGVAISILNDAEWAFARKACRRDTAWCFDSNGDCPLRESCESAGMDPMYMIAEPDSKHGHY
jgi:hypothetical protein